MANENHRKILVVEAALDFNTGFSTLDNLPAGDLAWSAPVTSLEDCDEAEFFFQIKTGPTSPEGSVQFYLGRAGSNLRDASSFATLTDHGTEGAAGTITSILACLEYIDAFGVQTEADAVWTVSFKVPNPGGICQPFVYNNTDEAFNGTSSPHAAYVRGWGPELQ